jgi:DNA repair exonuclease SbcCD ATPase subunit
VTWTLFAQASDAISAVESFGVPAAWVAAAVAAVALARKAGPRLWTVLEGIAAQSHEARENVTSVTKAFEALANAQQQALTSLSDRLVAMQTELVDLYELAAARGGQIERQMVEMTRLERELEQALRRESKQADVIAQLTGRVELLEREIEVLRERLGEGDR